MSQPEAVTPAKPNSSLLIRGAIWIAIGALIAAALVCVVWVLIDDQGGLIGRAFLTILLLAAFAGIALLEAGLAPNRPDWLALASMITWIVALIAGAVKIWLPDDSPYFGSGAERFFQLLVIVGILQLALLHVRLFLPAASRYVTVFTRVILYVTLIFLAALVGMLVFFLTLPHTFVYPDLYWRIVVALAILVAVGTTLIPLLNALFAPKKQAPAAPAAVQQWPTYADGVTPLPVLPDGSPDWNAYYTGYPTVAQVAPGYAVQAPVPVALPAALAAEPVWPEQAAPAVDPGSAAPQTPAPAQAPAPTQAPAQAPAPAPEPGFAMPPVPPAPTQIPPAPPAAPQQ